MSTKRANDSLLPAALALAMTLIVLVLWPDAAAVWLKERLDGLAPDGGADFLTLARVRDLARAAAAFLPCCLFAWFAARATRVSTADDVRTASPRLPWVEVALAIGLVLFGLARIHTGPPLTKDTKFYLSESLDAAEAGGPVGIVRGCFTGDYRQDNRHPFYPGVLSTIAEPSDRFTERARLFSLLGAVMAFACFIRLCRRTGGPNAGLVGGALLATNGTFLDLSVSVACETWWMAFAVLWFDQLTRNDGGKPVRRAAFAGAAAGLAWLTKGTGTLLLVAGALHLLWPGLADPGLADPGLADPNRARRPMRRTAWRLAAFLLAFALISLPLLWRNTQVFGNPLWNINSAKVMWLDRWADFHDPEAMAQAGAADYLRTHSASDMGNRLAIGSAKQGVHLLGILAPMAEHAGIGLVVLALVLLGFRRGTASDRRRPKELQPEERPPEERPPGRRRLLILLFVLYFAAFAWYSRVVADGRFLAALIPLLLVPATWLGIRRPLLRAARVLTTTVVTLAVLLGFAGVLGGALDFRPDSFRPAADAPAVHEFLLRRVGANEYADYYLGPSDGLGFDWDRRIRGARRPLPWGRGALAADATDSPGRQPRFAIVELNARVPAGIREVWVEPDGSGGWRPRPPENWRLLESIPPGAPRVLVFARKDLATP